MSKAPSKKALAEAGRRKLEAFRRAKAEGSAAKQAKASAELVANAEETPDIAAATASGSVPEGSHVSELHSATTSTHVPSVDLPLAAGDTSVASHGTGSSATAPTAATPAPASKDIEPAFAVRPSAANDVPEFALPAARIGEARPSWLPAPRSQVAAPPPQAAEAQLPGSSSQPAEVGSQVNQALPPAPQQSPTVHDTTAGGGVPSAAGNGGDAHLLQQPSPADSAASAVTDEQDAMARLARRASFEASHSPFIALSRSASGRVNKISDLIDSASGTPPVGGRLESRLSGAAQLSEVASRLSAHSTAWPERQVLPAGGPVSAAASDGRTAAASPPSAGSRQPWYSKLFASAPENADSSRSSEADGRLRPASGADAAREAPADLGSALKAFMGVDEPPEVGTGLAAVEPVAASGHPATSIVPAHTQQSAAAPVPSAAAAPPPLIPDSRGQAALADGYSGAAGSAQTAYQTAVPSPRHHQTTVSAELGSTASAAAGAAAAALQSTDAAASMRAAKLGRPASFQDWAGQPAQLPGPGLPEGDSTILSGSSPNPSSSASSTAVQPLGSSTQLSSYQWQPPSESAAYLPSSHRMQTDNSAGDDAQRPGPQPRVAQSSWLPGSRAAAQLQPEKQYEGGQQTADFANIGPVQRQEPEGADSDHSSQVPAGAAAGESVDRPPPSKHSASAAMANGISAWLAAPSTPEALPDDKRPRAPDQPASMHALAATGPASEREARTSAALREHIDQLTREGFELRRGLTQQADLAATLAAENANLTDDFNRERERTRELDTTLQRLLDEVSAQGLTVEALAAERDAARLSAHGATDRVKALAAEVVALEEARVAARTAELRAAAAARESGEEARAAGAQAAKLFSERESLAAAISSLQAEKQALRVKLRRAGSGTDAAAAGAAAPPSQPPQVEPEPQQSFQEAANGASAPGAEAAAAEPDRAELHAAAMALPAVSAGDAAMDSAGAAPRSPTHTTNSAALPDHADTAEAARQSRRIAAAAAAMAARAAATEAAAAGPAVAVLQQLLPWRLAAPVLEAGKSAGSLPAGVDEAARLATQQQAGVLAAIGRAAAALADEKRACLAALEAQQAEIVSARAAARDARLKLAATQQRFELMVGRSMLPGGLSGSAPGSAPASPAQQHWPPRPGVPSRKDWMNGTTVQPRKLQHVLQ